MKKIRLTLNINKIIEFLTFSDIMILSGWGLITPIIAVFFTEQIEGGSVALAGFASTTYFLVKSVLQIPIAKYIDKKKGERDDLWIMVTGSILISLSAFLYIFIKLPWQVYLVQVIYGIGGALSYPAWLAIFTRHIDRGKEGYEWSIYYTTTDLGTAFAAGLGGILASRFGYDLVFFIVGIMSIIGTVFLAEISKKLKKQIPTE